MIVRKPERMTEFEYEVESVVPVADSRSKTKSSDKLNSLVQEEVNMIKESQDKLQKLVESVDPYEHTVNLDTVESVQDIVMKSEDLIIMVKVIIKVRNELGHARLDLEKAKKANKMVAEGKQRVQWLEKKLEKLLIECHTMSSLLLRSTNDGFTQGVSLADTYLMSTFEGHLTSSECHRMFSDVGGYTRSVEDKSKRQKHYNMAMDVVQISQKMVSEDNKNGHSLEEEESFSLLNDQTFDTDHGRSQSRLLPAIERTDDENVAFSSPGTLSGEPSPCRESLNSQVSPLNTNGSLFESLLSSDESADDEVDKYWKSDHHKFEWADMGVQRRTPLSWHSLGLPVQDSFVPKERPSFTPELPWKKKAIQVNNVMDIHKIALDKLYAKLHHIYDAIEKATEASINPIPRNDKIETKMGNIESVPSSAVQKAVGKRSAGFDVTEERERDDKRLPNLATKNVSFSKTLHRSAGVMKTPKLLYPRHSSVWCSSQISEGRVVKKIAAAVPVKANRTQTILSKKLLSETEQCAKELAKQEELLWRPSIVYKMVKATKVLKIFQAQVKQWSAMNHSGPKWKRVEWLLGSSGIQSPIRANVIKALKSLSILRCSEVEVGTALRKMLRKSQDSRILYEASKALVLTGNWDLSAVDILLNALKFGTNCLKKEILEALSSADDIPFFDKITGSFQELRSLLVRLIKGSDIRLGFSAALCLGKLSIVDPVAKNFLMGILKKEMFSSQEKGEALDVLVRQMNCKDDIIINSLLHELNTSINWKVRVQACDLLIFLGPVHVLTKNPDEIFWILDRLLWDHANQAVRSKVAQLLNKLRLRKRACGLVIKRLEDPKETVRGRAIISLATLEMKGGKELKALLDILALDSSVYARIQAIRAFSKLRWIEPRVLRSLKEREKGGGVLAKEARKAIKMLTEEQS